MTLRVNIYASVLDPYSRKEISLKLDPTKLIKEINPPKDVSGVLFRLKQVAKLVADITNVIMRNIPLIELFKETIRLIVKGF